MNEALDALVRARRLATDALKYRQWKALLANWGKWYGETGPTTWLWSGTDATLESYELAIRDWTAWFQRTFPDAAGSLPKPPPHYGGDGPRMDVPGWLIGVAAAGGAFLLYKMLK
jgi:hypothetical protein